MGRLDGKTAAITGAARGIGAEYAKKLAAEGANVIVTDILDPAEVVAEINAAGGKATGMVVDVTSDDDLNAMVAKAQSEYGALNILVNNAGLFANLELKPLGNKGCSSCNDESGWWQDCEHCFGYVLLRPARFIALYRL
jgi:NAD(P)-dependent dehydrogenase (short-subunit alcohol dehydrogenase family)